MNGSQAYALSRSYTDNSMAGGGAVKGKNCVVKSITDITDGHRVTFQWTLDNGTVQTAYMDVKDGKAQYGSLPTPAAGISGQICQYIGPDTADLKNGYFYICQQVDGVYKWVQKDVQDATGGGIVIGYYKAADGKMYEDASYTTAIVGKTETLYVGVNTKKSYYYDGTNFIRLDDETIQFATLPVASSETLGMVAQYIGATTSSYTNGYFYQVVNQSGTYKWVEKKVQSGGSGGSSELENDLRATVEVGGVSVGDTFTAGTSLEAVLRAILSPTIYPTYVAPSASISYGASQYYAVKSNVAALSATVSYNAGAINLDGVKQNDRGGAATNYAIATTGADTEYSDSSASSGSFSVPTLTRATKGTIKVKGTVSYAAGPQPKDSSGADYQTPLPAGSVSAEKTLTFIQAYYYGASNSTTISDFTGLTENVTAKGTKTFSYTTSNQHMVIAYDSSYGNLKNILDPNGFETISGWTKSTLTVDGFSYYVYVANSATTDTGAAFTFKY